MTSSITYDETKQTLTGSDFDDTINAKEYFAPTDEVYCGQGLIINAGAGDDVIYDTRGYDTITAGSGTNTIYLDYNSNLSEISDIDFLGDSILISENENLTIQYNLAQNPEGIDYQGSYAYKIYKCNQNDVAIQIDEDLYHPIYNCPHSTYSTYLLKDIFKYSSTSSVIFNIGNETIDFSNYAYDGKVITTSQYIGDDSDENIISSKYTDKNIKTLGGNDTIVSSYSNDTITGGTGINTIKYSINDSNDTIILSDNETLIIDFNYISKEDLKYSFDGNSLIISFYNYSGQITIKDYSKKISYSNSNVYITFDGKPLYEGTENVDYINLKTYNFDITSLKSKYIGTNFNENIIGTDNINQNIKTLGGNDIIDAGLGNDTITGGEDINIIKYTNGDGNDTIILTKNETAILDLYEITKENLSFTFNKNNLLISYIDKNYEKETITIKDYKKKDIVGVVGNVYITFDGKSIETGTENLDYINLKTFLFEQTPTSKSFSGSWINDNVIGSDSINQKISTNAGNDIIDAGKGNDTITGGIGQNTIKYTNGDGNDTIVLTKDETAIIDLYEIQKENLDFFQVGKSLFIYYLSKYGDTQNLTIKDFFKKDIVGENGNVYITFNGNPISGTENVDYINLKTFEFKHETYNKSFSGTWVNESVIGVDDINQKISTGAGNDTIDAGMCNDTITGGTGINTIKYTNGDGNDTIVLTKDETAILDLYGITKDQLNYSFNKNDLVISYINNWEETQKITIKNFAKKDVVGEKGNVYITFEGQDILAGTENKDYINLKTKYYIYKNFTDKNKSYTSNWLTDEIDATSLNEYNIANKKGVSITAKYDTNKLTGSKYNDTIKGGNNNDTIISNAGDDKIYGGTGTNTIQFKKGDGTDTVYSTKNANDTLEFIGTSFDDLKFSQEKNNLIITGYGEETDKVIVANYYKGNSSIQNILINGITKSISQSIEEQPEEETPESGGDVHYQPYDGKHIVGSNGNNKLNGTEKNDIIHGKLGSDTIYGKGGNDTIDAFIDAKIYGGDGNDFLLTEYGYSTIYGGNGNDSISAGGRHNQIFAEDGNDTISAYSACYIEAGKGDDKVEITGNYPEESYIYLGEGNDSAYVGTSAYLANIYGGSGNDTFDIYGTNNKLYGNDGDDTYIIETNYGTTNENTFYDSSGDSDCIIFEFGNTSNIDIFVNVYSNGSHDNDLILFYKDGSEMTITIKEYFNEGKIETIKFDKYDNTYVTEEYINNCIQNVANWLSDKGYNSCQDVLNSNIEEDIKTLYAYFD